MSRNARYPDTLSRTPATRSSRGAQRRATRSARDTRPPPALLEELGDHEIRARFEALDQVFHGLRRVREIRVQRDGAVPLRAVGSLQGQAEKRLEAPGVAAALAVRDDGHRQHLGVRGEYFGRVVVRGI